jgi:hypothetical protein
MAVSLENFVSTDNNLLKLKKNIKTDLSVCLSINLFSVYLSVLPSFLNVCMSKGLSDCLSA